MAVAVLAVLVVASSASAEPLPPAEVDFVGRIHRERSAAGLAGYSAATDVVADLVAVARAHAEDMADQNRLHHNARLPDQVENWDSLGENVGKGASVDDIHRVFMDSPSHRAEILSTRFTQVGVGVVERDGVLWVVQVFRKPSAPAPAPAAPSPTTSLGSVATPLPMVRITTPAAVGEPRQATLAEAEISDAPAASASGGGGGAGLRSSRSLAPVPPREVTIPMAIAAALLALMAAALVTEVTADERRVGRSPVASFLSV